MDILSIVRQYLTSANEVTEVQVEYKDGSTMKYVFSAKKMNEAVREAALLSLFNDVVWEEVEEVEVEMSNGEKVEIDLDDEEDEA
ncbi:MAG: hypothetical protein P0Y55_11065 [Candidatus Cohnella colombiensis]|uniref:Uncharacterized protein n=1 Tax=Candidatus Cohnella colombiensis TaxID=3121368 RepID=A0AA95F1S4_9BACL|nr:MAG: hypothetical protein P0Y55_11065 [Cohnella sp.]